ncbi:hypothetical protein [Nostoc sp.]
MCFLPGLNSSSQWQRDAFTKKTNNRNNSPAAKVSLKGDRQSIAM